MQSDVLLAEMMKDYGEQKAPALSEEQSAVVKRMARGMMAYHEYLSLTSGLFERPVPPLEPPVRPERLTARGSRSAESHGGFYLSKAEREQFETRGFVGPFRVLPEAEARAIGDEVMELHERNFDENYFSSKQIEEVLRAADQWTVDISGFGQAQNHKRLWEVVTNDRIAQPMASLLGDDVICWRSQFFCKEPGAGGTFWHQTDTFREGGPKIKLVPSSSENVEMVGLTAWVALSDANRESACMRFIPGTFADGRIEAFTYHLADNILAHLHQIPDEDELQRLISIIFFSPIFDKGRAAFELAVKKYDDVFENRELVDVEMKPGEALLFHSMTIHGSYGNRSDQRRLAMVARYTTNDVQVMPGFTTETTPTPAGTLEYPLGDLGCIQVHGSDRYGWNRILPYRW
jgi:non-haem Fe2+, alpha-ketoglutarate-dependent halogenase